MAHLKLSGNIREMKLIASVVFIAFCAIVLRAQPCVDAAKQVKPVLSEETARTYGANLAIAREAYNKNPTVAEELIWYGRRMAYTGEYKEAIKVFTEGVTKFPNDARMYRHRGHRYITLRCFDDAIRDLTKAADLMRRKPDEIEPDGLPNARNIPTSTLKGNIEYHLGLAYYLKSEWSRAAARFMNSYNIAVTSKSPDMKVAAAHWVYMSAARHDRKAREDADRLLKREIGDDEDIIENQDYYKLIKLYKGDAKVEDLLKTIKGDANTLGSASLGYGIGNYFLYNGDGEKATEVFGKIVAGDQWSSFGYIAAEVELTRQPSK